MIIPMNTRETSRPGLFWSFGGTLLLAVFLVATIGGGRALAASESEDGIATGAFLARKGQAEAVIVIGKESSASDRFVAEELQDYLQKLSQAELRIVTDDQLPVGHPLIVLGGPQVNPLSAQAEKRQLVSFSGLKADGYILKTIELDGRPAVVAGGNDETGTMYAAYELLERLGIVFQITGDVIPEQKPDLSLPELDMRTEPMARYRGFLEMHAWNFFMGLQDYRRLIDQMAKLKFNYLQFSWGIGTPWLEFSFDGTVAELTTTPESGYLAWGRESRSWGRSPHSTTGTANDVRVGREVFPQEYVGAPEFATVRTPAEAYRTAREFLHELIRYAHQRHVKVSLLLQELSFVPPNLANVTPELRGEDAYMYQRYCGVALSPADPRTLDIWETAMRALIETYPEADSYGFWTTEHSPEMEDPRIQEILRQNADLRAKLPSVAEIRRRGNVIVGGASHAPEKIQLDADFLQVYLATQLIERVKKHHPNVQLGVMTLFRGYKLPIMDEMMPKDVWLANMEQSSNTGSTMDFFSGITGRELYVVPRITDDGNELNIQFNAMEYDRDEIITGTAKYGLAGIVGQTLHPRNSEYSVRYLAEGAWNPNIRPRSFYVGYLGRLYGREALETVLPAYLLLEENEKAMVYWGRSEIFRSFKDWSPLDLLRTNVNYREDIPTVDLDGEERVNVAEDQSVTKGTAKPLGREELVRAINATWREGPFWKWRQALVPQHAAAAAGTEREHYENRAAQCREALDLLLQARAKVLPGSRAELEYVIYKTEGFISYLNVLSACSEAVVILDRAWLGLVDGDQVEFGIQLGVCRSILERADRLARAAAGQMIAYADDPTEKYLLMRYNRNVIAGIENAQIYVAEVVAFLNEKTASRELSGGLPKENLLAEGLVLGGN